MDATKALATLANLETAIAKASTLAADLKALIASQPTVGQDAKQLLDTFVHLWGQHHGKTYLLTMPVRDMARLKTLLRTLTVGQIQSRMHEYFESTDRFHVQSQHSLPVFLASINQFGVNATNDDRGWRPRPIGCKHPIPCRDDADHTARMVKESRA